MYIANIFKLRKKAGDFAIEVELENSPGELFMWASNNFIMKSDGSLRDNGIEICSIEPHNKNNLSFVLRELTNIYRTYPLLRISDRCGIHVHINCQELTVKQVINFVCLYLLLENILIKYCGETRESNTFCLRACDSEWVLDQLINVKKNGLINSLLISGDNKYGSINLSSLKKFGSLEFRGLASTFDIKRIKVWINTLLRIKEISLQYDRLSDLIENISTNGAINYLQFIFDEYFNEFNFNGIEQSLYSNIRMVQELIYYEEPSIDDNILVIYDEREE